MNLSPCSLLSKSNRPRLECLLCTRACLGYMEVKDDIDIISAGVEGLGMGSA